MPNQSCCACACRTRGAHTLITDDNLAGVAWIFDVTGRSGGDALKVGAFLCRKARESKAGVGGRGGGHDSRTVQPCLSPDEVTTAERLMVGKSVAKWFRKPDGRPSQFYYGTVTSLLSSTPGVDEMEAVSSSLSYEVKFATAPPEHQVVSMTQAEAVVAHDDFLAVEATLAVDARREAQRERMAASRAAPVPIAADAAADDGASPHRPLTRHSMCDPVWWNTWGHKVSPTLHTHMFGFQTPEVMKHFFDTFFSEQLQEPNWMGLTQYEIAAVALWRMRCASRLSNSPRPPPTSPAFRPPQEARLPHLSGRLPGRAPLTAFEALRQLDLPARQLGRAADLRAS